MGRGNTNVSGLSVRVENKEADGRKEEELFKDTRGNLQELSLTKTGTT